MKSQKKRSPKTIAKRTIVSIPTAMNIKAESVMTIFGWRKSSGGLRKMQKVSEAVRISGMFITVSIKFILKTQLS